VQRFGVRWAAARKLRSADLGSGGRRLRSAKAYSAVAAVVGALACLAAAPGAALAVQAQAAAVGSAPASQHLDLVIPLAIDQAGLNQFATEVSTPHSPLYGQFESVATLARTFGARPAAAARVIDYLRSVGATAVSESASKMFVSATMTVRLAEHVFATPLSRYRTGAGKEFVAPAAVARGASAAVPLPAPLRGVATGVVGLDTEALASPSGNITVRQHSGPIARKASPQPTTAYNPASGTTSGCAGARNSGGFTPNQYETAYDYTPFYNSGLKGQGQTVAVVEIDGFKDSDLKTFARCFGFSIPAIDLFGVGVSKPLPPGGETTLDLEVLDAAAPGMKKLEVFETTATASSLIKAFVAPIVTPHALPQLISSSVGICEPGLLQAFGRAGVNTVNQQMALGAAAGITVMSAAGDTGSSDCRNSSFPDNPPIDALAVDYPGSSQWVTSVGGTQLFLKANNQIRSNPNGQFVWNDTTFAPAGGGGGFSEIFGRPAYQNGVVGPNHRAVPDISALADNPPGYAIFCTAQADCGGHGWQQIGGTSAATPLSVAGMALVDEDLSRHGQEFLGFVNPLLYAIGKDASLHGHVFNDVTAINNDVGPFIPVGEGGNGLSLNCCNAHAGYDEASGWGSVYLANLDQVARGVEPKIPNISLSFVKHQSPVKAGKLQVKMTCSAPCSIYAFGVVRISNGPHFDLRTPEAQLTKAGSKVLTAKFTGKQENELKAALAAHHKILTEMLGADLDGGAIARLTPGQTLTIKS
jgi:subtilase family serine protease